jgi:orotate phosphoribosyltransferase
MKKGILHISDIHVASFLDLKDRETGSDKKFQLTTDSNSTLFDSYVQNFTTFVKTNFGSFELTLLVTGDITNQGDVLEFKIAKKFFEKVIADLKINKSNIILLPGDHDVNRDLNRTAFVNGKINSQKKSYEYLEKYDNFSTFYFEVLNENFEPNNSIVKIIEFDKEKLVLVGLNSCYKIDYEGGNGFFELDKLRQEFESLQSKYISKNYSIIASFHHNLYSSYENNATGQWDNVNRRDFIALLNEFEIKCLFFGNEHTRNSQLTGTGKDNLILYSDSGCFGTKENNPSFKVYEIVKENEDLKLKNNLIVLQNINKNDEPVSGKWVSQNLRQIGEFEFFDLVTKSTNIIITENNTIDKLTSQNEDNFNIQEKVEVVSEPFENDKYENKEFQDYLFSIVKNKKLFHSGHFHWSETSRAHNWIDISKILSDKNDLFRSKNAIIDVIEKCINSSNIDFIIGLGMEGNILSTRAVVKFGVPYSFLPYSYRYDDHNEFEKKLNHSNQNQFKNVLIISDVVNDGRTIRKLINKREEKFFKEVENIYVVSLFYTGDIEKKNSTILNSDKIVNFDNLNDHIESRIKFYYVLDLKVEKCPYNENFREDCILVKHNIGCIYKFYNEKRAIEKKLNSI